MLRDPAATRWLDPEMLSDLGDALDEMWARRQSCFYTAGIVTSMPAKPAVVGGTVYLQDQYRMPAAHYLSYLCLLSDSDDAANLTLAMKHYDIYEKGMN